MKNTCTECKYFHDVTAEYHMMFVCRRYPPGEEGFPEIENNWWCGEFVMEGNDEG